MKYSIIFICMLLSAAASAQITLNAGDYTRTMASVTDSVKDITAASIPATTMGANQLWDFSGAVYDTGWANVYYRPVPTSGVFAAAQYGDSTGDTVSYYGYGVKKIQSVTAGGIVTYGERCEMQRVSLAAGSPNPYDYMDIDSQDVAYSSPMTAMLLPLTYTNSWKSNATMVTKFHIQAGGIGFAYAPGEFDSKLSESDSVTGWGKIRLKLPGGSTAYDIDVLQVRSFIQRVDNPFVNGTALDFNQEHYLWIFNGNIEQTFEYRYYRKGEVTPLVTVSCAYGFNTITGGKINTQRLQTAVAEIAENKGFHIYPNPANGRLFVDAMQTYPSEITFEMYNSMGQLVSNKVLKATIKHNEIIFPTTIAPGTYYLRLLSSDQVIYHQSLTINK